MSTTGTNHARYILIAWFGTTIVHLVYGKSRRERPGGNAFISRANHRPGAFLVIPRGHFAHLKSWNPDRSALAVLCSRNNNPMWNINEMHSICFINMWRGHPRRDRAQWTPEQSMNYTCCTKLSWDGDYSVSEASVLWFHASGRDVVALLAYAMIYPHVAVRAGADQGVGEANRVNSRV